MSLIAQAAPHAKDAFILYTLYFVQAAPHAKDAALALLESWLREIDGKVALLLLYYCTILLESWLREIDVLYTLYCLTRD